MDTAESLKRTIALTQELESVVKTMKALAGVNIRQCENASQAVEMGFKIALRDLPPQALPLRRAPGTKLGAVVFGSIRGCADS